LPAPSDHIVGCRFRGRCPLYLTLGQREQALCQQEDPDLDPAADGRGVACHHTRGVLTG
jgi:peptide/nickel transport system ATP-binding protein